MAQLEENVVLPDLFSHAHSTRGVKTPSTYVSELQVPAILDKAKTAVVNLIASPKRDGPIIRWPHQDENAAFLSECFFPRSELSLLYNPYRSPEVVLRLLCGSLLFHVPSMYHLALVLADFSLLIPEKSRIITYRYNAIHAYFDLENNDMDTFQRAYLLWLLGSRQKARSLVRHCYKEDQTTQNPDVHLLLGNLAVEQAAKIRCYARTVVFGCEEARCRETIARWEDSKSDVLVAELLKSGDALSLHHAGMMLPKQDDRWESTLREAVRLSNAKAAV
eukprot:GILK01014531.1.p1 GENE.GILK01014531.1~~GILK01014531.1.p1  ORF type:complete len:298 (-),score=15.35 GILK01014531.1:237-1067(-)